MNKDNNWHKLVAHCFRNSNINIEELKKQEADRISKDLGKPLNKPTIEDFEAKKNRALQIARSIREE